MAQLFSNFTFSEFIFGPARLGGVVEGVANKPFFCAFPSLSGRFFLQL
jgi:hypothetical protein